VQGIYPSGHDIDTLLKPPILDHDPGWPAQPILIRMRRRSAGASVTPTLDGASDAELFGFMPGGLG
jgi:hypothetical protein